MMKSYDWIVIGGGITGATLSYELAKQGLSVLLLEQDKTLQNATRFSYGGLSYWLGTTDLTRQLCQEGITIHRQLSQELDAATQFRELDVILTILPEDDPHKVAQRYANCAIPPRLITVAEACEMEPLLNKDTIAGALTVSQGQISPESTTQAYYQAFTRLSGEREIAQVTGFLQENHRFVGVKTNQENYHSANIVVCAGGLSRQLLKLAEISISLYYTHGELVEILPNQRDRVSLKTIIMQAVLKRLIMEGEASQIERDSLWDKPGNIVAPSILDAGAIQLPNGIIRFGQLSRVLSDPYAKVDGKESETQLRHQVGNILPTLAKLPGNWYECLVAFTRDRLPLIGKIEPYEGIHIFSGFSNPLVLVPALARRFAHVAITEKDDLIEKLSPSRFVKDQSTTHP
jgi:glycine/D-amino acid oxidase-like deaminating enzyme